MKAWQSIGCLTGWALLPLACSAQVPPDYQGEPLATIEGKVVTTQTAPSRDIEAALIWADELRTADSADQEHLVWGSTRIPVDAHFPSTFTMNLYDPPKRWDNVAVDYAVTGRLVLLPAGGDNPIDPNSILGGAKDFMVQYFPRDAVPNDPNDYIAWKASRYGTSPTKGYHFSQISVTEEKEAEYYRRSNPGICIRIVENGLDSNLSINLNTFENQRFRDDYFARCQKYLPEAQTCTRYFGPTTPEQDTETARCLELEAEVASHRAQQSPLDMVSEPAQYTEIPQGTIPEIAITLGVTLPELLFPRAPL